jgi:hypothetical protein
MIKLLILLIAILLSSVLYRLGGIGKPFNTKFRDLGCPTVFTALMIILFGFNISFWWAYLITFGLSFGALTTYWDFLFGYDNYWFHGFMCGLAALPLVLFIPFSILAIRLIICTLGMGLWSKFIDQDWLEEGGRGAFFIL